MPILSAIKIFSSKNYFDILDRMIDKFNSDNQNLLIFNARHISPILIRGIDYHHSSGQGTRQIFSHECYEIIDPQLKKQLKNKIEKFLNIELNESELSDNREIDKINFSGGGGEILTHNDIHRAFLDFVPREPIELRDER